ncbi:MAG: HIT family protein [Burkholderiaceae bacterium]|nr:HIT family protein [Burkholderiaceae bacterium]
MTTPASCPLCHIPETGLLWSNSQVRVIAVNEADLPGYTRVIWAEHLPEMTDLSSAQRAELMEIVWRVETAQRQVLQPDKINLAQLGNMVPHVHWHVIPRWLCDPYFPQAIWAQPAARSASQLAAWEGQHATLQDSLATYHQVLTDSLNSLG